MRLQYVSKDFEGNSKYADFGFGLHDIEYGEPFKKWIWTHKWFGMSINNVNKVNLRILSPINNKLIVNNTLKFDILENVPINIVIEKLKTVTVLNCLCENEINIGSRSLGLQLLVVSVDDTDIF
jgi:hypothetical protein